MGSQFSNESRRIESHQSHTLSYKETERQADRNDDAESQSLH
jgi:hypothetical protein